MPITVKKSKELNFLWEGRDKKGKIIKGEIQALSEAVAAAKLRRQGISVGKIRKRSFLAKRPQKIKEKDITLFTRQLSTMMRAGVPLLQSFDIVGKGHSNASVQKLLADVRNHIESGSSMSQAFNHYPQYFDPLFCNLVRAGEQAGILDTILDRLATYKEKILAIKGKIKSALFYPASIIVVAFVITTIIMIFVIPAFKSLFTSFGADLPAPTLLVMKISDIFVHDWWLIFGGLILTIWGFFRLWKRSLKVQYFMDRLFLHLPVFGPVIQKATIARWTRTLSTMFAAGVPLVEALDSVAGASGNLIYQDATKQIQSEVSTGTSLTVSMQNSNMFPNMVLQMVAIGEESGALDDMLSKIADFYENEVDDAVSALSSLMEPIIMVVLGVIIGGLVIAMYLPIFKMGSVIH
ncbi:MAG: type II secretion system F family protein [Proteobacteria bacterium]|nr:type II secretion system F family protein [Pseudomonadota bacterium]MDE3207844.1 type II secretion system F family protein [Pseudomonadota bacterium]